MLHQPFNQISLDLEKNGYPKYFLNKLQISHFLGKHCAEDSPKENIIKEPLVKSIFMRLPFIRDISLQVEKEINSFCAKLDFELKIKVFINQRYL